MRIILLLAFTILLISCGNNNSEHSSAVLVKSEIPVITTEKSAPTIKNQSMKTLDEVMGKFDPKKHPEFIVIEKKYADIEGRIMHKQAYESFISMWNAAKADGITLTIRSATRNFDYQRGIWERKWTGATKVSGKKLNETVTNEVERARKILEYSSMPGTSRHHWGTDIDLNAFENSYFENGEGLNVYNWLIKNAPSFGFCQPYTAKGKDRPHGYNEEKWHWSYKPIAMEYYNKAIESMKDELIAGFQGSEAAVEIGVVEKYIFGVSHNCK